MVNKNRIKVVSYKKLIHEKNQYTLRIPKEIMTHLMLNNLYDRNTDVFRIIYEDGDLKIELFKHDFKSYKDGVKG